MIISHEHRYLFVELPRTGSTAIRRELRQLYGGTPILHKHATYEEYLRVASPRERDYFVFSGIRHPLDSAVSRYFKLRSDHKGRFSDPDSGGREGGRLNRFIDERMFAFMGRDDPAFAEYFMRFYVLPYDTWASLSHERFDEVIRFEDLADGFARVLRSAGIEPVRPLPVVNSTAQRGRDYASHYPSRTHVRARRVFGPYMERWGYEFPETWRVTRPTTWQRAQYEAFSTAACLYWRHLRGRI